LPQVHPHIHLRQVSAFLRVPLGISVIEFPYSNQIGKDENDIMEGTTLRNMFQRMARMSGV